MWIPAEHIPLFGFVVAGVAALIVLVFVGRYFLRSLKGQRLASGQGLQALADRLGLQDYGGYRVTLDAEHSCLSWRRADVALEIRQLHLNSQVDKQASAEVTFATGNAAFDRFFRVRRADDVTEGRLAASPERLAPLQRFLRRWGNVLGIRADSKEVTFAWRNWIGAKHGVPSPVLLEQQLPEMLVVANAILGAAAVPPLIPADKAVRSSTNRLLFSGAEELPAQILLHRPGRETEPVSPTELVDRLYHRGLSPLSQVSWEGQEPLPISQQPALRNLFRDAQIAPVVPPSPSAAASASRLLRRAAYSPQGPAIVGGVVALSGLLTAWSFYDWNEHARAERWPTAAARIVSSKAHYYSGSSSSSGDARGRTSGSSSKGRYGWRVTYAYTVKGRSYTNSRHCLVSGAVPAAKRGKKADVDRLVKQHPPGSEVRIIYDPDDPSEAVFKDLCRYKKGLKASLYQSMVAMSLVCASLCLLALLFLLWRFGPRLRRLE